MKTISYAIFALMGVVSQAQALTPLFDAREIPVEGRVRFVEVKDLLPGGGDELIIGERNGSYPNWVQTLSVYAIGEKRKMSLVGRTDLPPDAIFFDFLREKPADPSHLLLVRAGAVELWPWSGHGFVADPKLRLIFDSGFQASSNREAVRFKTLFPVPSDRGQFMVPTSVGAAWIKMKNKGLKLLREITLPSKTFFLSDVDNLPFELPFWIRGTLWHPSFSLGRFAKEGPDSLIWTWMDEVTIVPADLSTDDRNISFQQLTEKERDDAKTFVVSTPLDLNGDHLTDFVVNKFRGSATSMEAEMSLFIAKPDGTIPTTPIKIQPSGNRAGGVIAADLKNRGKMDLVVASGQYNLGAIIRALIRRLVHIDFSFYLNHPDGYHLAEPDHSVELTFQVNLEEGDIDGLFPNLEGDFNGDGFKDAIYAKDRKGLTVILQRPKDQEFFPLHQSRTFEVHVPRKIQIGDLDGDGKSDVVLFDRQASGNRIVTVLLNNGVLQ